MEAGLRCFTAPGMVFTTRTQMQDHYQSDWHRYNLKRKVANMPPITKEEFEARKAAALAKAAEQKAASTSHLKKGKRDRKNRLKKERRAGNGTNDPVGAERREQLKNPPNLAADPAQDPATDATDATEQTKQTEEHANIFNSPSKSKDGDSDRPIVEDAEDPAEEEALPEININQCLFDSHVCEDVTSNVEYMSKKYGFFLPDIEYLEDLDGMIHYLSEKVRHGAMCLYCERLFRTPQACQQHMIDSGHCKVKYDEEEDLEEFADFYNFSSTWDDIEVSDEEDGGEEGGGDEGEWETASDDDEDEGADGEEGESKTDAAKSKKRKKKLPKIEFLDSGELLIKDGNRERLIGMREFKRYYAQRFKPEDERDSVKASTRERLLLCYRHMGVDTHSAIAMARHANVSQALALGRKHLPQFSGLALQEKRTEIQRAAKYEQRVGRQNNLVLKNRLAGKIRGEGVGVHG